MKPLWTPSPARAASSELARFMKLAGKPSYEELHRWSIEPGGEFWSQLWDFCAVKGTRGARTVDQPGRMPGTRFFPDATLNYAENLLRHRPGTRIEIFEAAGHALFVDDADRFNRVLLAFVDELDLDRARGRP